LIKEVTEMAKRKIVHINEEKCNGCGLCIPNCAEGALQIIDGKAKLVSDKYCDGLGACLGHCPMDAIEIIEREAEEFDEKAVEEYLANAKKGDNSKHTGHHHGRGCPGSRVVSFESKKRNEGMNVTSGDIKLSIKPQLKQWPVQLHLVPVNAPYFDGAHLLVTADCVPFAYADYHLDLLKGKSVVVGCPKLDDAEYYVEKLTDIIRNNDIRSITVAHMEVPCCSGMVWAVRKAVENSGKSVPIKQIEITIDGRKKEL
jgi:NAD-dependent dihydropyrimidine dehydrogenase PreA subunit